MLNLITTATRRFAKDEDGAVTVDFVVLCGAVVGLGVIVGGTILGQIETAAGNLAGEITASEQMNGS